MEKLVEKIRQRFQFLATISLFFPLLLDALLKEGNNLNNLNKVALGWGAVIAVLIIDYIFLEYVKKQTYSIIPKLVNFLIFLNLGAYVIIFIMFAALPEASQLPGFLFPVFKFLILSILRIPQLIFLILVINLLLPVYNRKEY